MNEDWMTELEVRAGDELERKMARYARLRLDPSTAQAKRARGAVMEAAWRQRIAGPATVAPDESPVAVAAAAIVSPATGSRSGRGLFAGWGPRRVALSFAAAGLAGLLLGSTAFASSRAGGPLYDARIALEELTLPTDPAARLEAELALAQGRLAEIVEAVAKDDPGAVDAAVRAYASSLEDLGDATGGPADRALIAVQFHRTILLDVLGRVPDDARAGIETALANSGRVIDRLDAAGTTPNAGGDSGTGTGAGSGSGAGNGNPGGNAGGAGNGQGAKPSKDPTPARTPAPAKPAQPARTAAPVATQEAKSPKPKPGGATQGESSGDKP